MKKKTVYFSDKEEKSQQTGNREELYHLAKKGIQGKPNIILNVATAHSHCFKTAFTGSFKNRHLSCFQF